MGVFDDNPYISVRPGPLTTGSRPADPDAYAQGDWWTIHRRGAVFELEYLSGELDGRARKLTLTPEEANAIRAGGNDALYIVQIAHGVG